VIRSWKDRKAKEVFAGRLPKGFPAAQFTAARRRLFQLDAAVAVEDLRDPPGNRLHALTEDRQGQWSISVNKQFRICFRWGAQGPEEVEFVGHH